MTDQPTASVDIARYCFGPIVARVEVGETVTWTNRDGALHNVFSAGGDWGWDSSIGPNGGTFSATFASPGVYPYVCTIHPTMAGAIVVGDGLGALAPYTPREPDNSVKAVGEAPGGVSAPANAVAVPSKSGNVSSPAIGSPPAVAIAAPDDDGDGGLLLAFAGLGLAGSLLAIGSVAGVVVARRR
jgi:hypothetical protein